MRAAIHTHSSLSEGLASYTPLAYLMAPKQAPPRFERGAPQERTEPKIYQR